MTKQADLEAVLVTWCVPFTHNVFWLSCFHALSWTRPLWQKCGSVMGVCYLWLDFRACFLALLAAIDLITVAPTAVVRTPLLTRIGIGAIADKAGTPDATKQKVTGLGFAKMLAATPGRILADSETSHHNIGCACYQPSEHCDRCALVPRCS